MDGRAVIADGLNGTAGFDAGDENVAIGTFE
jgi:hypothetical protein